MLPHRLRKKAKRLRKLRSKFKKTPTRIPRTDGYLSDSSIDSTVAADYASNSTELSITSLSSIRKLAVNPVGDAFEHEAIVQLNRAIRKVQKKLQRSDPRLFEWVSGGHNRFEALQDISEDENRGMASSRKTPIPSHTAGNIGWRLLRQMGWQGGGLGPTGAGIAAPIRAVRKRGRAGVGVNEETGQNSSRSAS